MQIPDDIDYSCPQEGDDIPDDRSIKPKHVHVVDDYSGCSFFIEIEY